MGSNPVGATYYLYKWDIKRKKENEEDENKRKQNKIQPYLGLLDDEWKQQIEQIDDDAERTN